MKLLNYNEMCECGHTGSMHYLSGCAADKCKCKNREKITLQDRIYEINRLLSFVMVLAIASGISYLVGVVFSIIYPPIFLVVFVITFVFLILFWIAAAGVF